MRINFNLYNYQGSFQGKKNSGQSQSTYKADSLEQFGINRKALVPSGELMRGISANNNNVFDTFTKIDDVTRSINFVKDSESWEQCLLEEIEEFKVARVEYELDKTPQNFDHMSEEMGDIFYTAASMAKNSGIDPLEAFKSTNRKFYNRINLMEKMSPIPLQDCKDHERRALWNAAKRKLYDAQAKIYSQNINTTV